MKRKPAPAFVAVRSVIQSTHRRASRTTSRRQIESAERGGGIVDELARYLARTQPGLRGFTRPNLFRMRQFYEAYRDNAIVTALLSQLPWTRHLLILSYGNRPEEREFYVRLAIREKWSSRELERQFRAGLFERTVLHPPQVSAVIRTSHSTAVEVCKDAYVLDFLDLPDSHSEADLHRGLLHSLPRFITELGRDLVALDLLFFHRGLKCLVAIELKAARFEPEHLGKRNFYLEALDRDVRKPHENPAIGLLLCATKDSEVVEYAFSRSLSPAMIAEYATQLPDKRLLQAKLHEFYQLLAPVDAAESDSRFSVSKRRKKGEQA